MMTPRRNPGRLYAVPSRCGLALPFSAATRTLLILPLCLLLWVIIGAAPASAHSVFIYAWQEEDGRICTNSYFSKKNKVQGGEVRMQSPDGQVLDKGESDPAGLCCFKARPGTGDLRFVVNAGQGHRAEFLLPGAQSGSFSQSVQKGALAGGAQADPYREPSLRDIVGGMGWLVGLAGIGAYVASRRKKG